MRGLLGVIRFSAMLLGMLVELFGAVWSFEFVTFAGNARHRNSHQQQGK